MIELEKFPFEKAVHLLTKVIPGFALVYVYNSRSPGAITSILSLPHLGYTTKASLLIATCFTFGYTLSTFINTVGSAVGGAIGALWASVTSRKHAYENQVAPWRDPKWRAAYICRFGSEAPTDVTLVLPVNAAELLLQLSHPFSADLADKQGLAENSLYKSMQILGLPLTQLQMTQNGGCATRE